MGEGVDVYIHVCFTYALVEGEWSASRPLQLYSGRKNPRHSLDRRLGGSESRSGRHAEVNILAIPGLELRHFTVQILASGQILV
jgi:hypothetical protein